MKRWYGVFLLVAMVITTPNHASAQFLKGLFKKKNKKESAHKEEAPGKTNTMPKPGPLKRKIDLQYPTSVKKSSYRIDVLAPLYVDELEKSGKRFPEKSRSGIEFYEGVKLATDTLNTFHYNIQVYVHDVAATASGVSALIRDHKLDSADLIIGALQLQDIPAVAQYAKKRRVNFVSALSPYDASVKDNPYFILLQPTLSAHCNAIIGYIQKKHPGKKMVLCYRSVTSADEAAYSAIIDNDETSSFKKLLCNTLPGKEQMAVLLDSTRTNYVVMGILENAFADSLLKQLYEWFPGYDFEVYGMPSWKTLPSLKKADAYPNVTLYFTAPFFFDASVPAAQSLEKVFRREYGGKPGELVYRGYETIYWYAYLLNEYGTIFNNKFNDNSACLFTKYDIVPKFDKELNFLYNENQHIYLYKYRSGSFIVEQP